jgi:hypothetical protein
MSIVTYHFMHLKYLFLNIFLKYFHGVFTNLPLMKISNNIWSKSDISILDMLGTIWSNTVAMPIYIYILLIVFLLVNIIVNIVTRYRFFMVIPLYMEMLAHT